MRLILDTKVLVAAMLALDGSPHLLFDGFLNDRFTLITSDAQLEEFSRVTRYPGFEAVFIDPRQGGWSTPCGRYP